MRHNYWSCSKFADWLRGVEKPKAATSNGWNQWRHAAQTSHRFRYWLAEEGLDKLQKFIFWPTDQLYNLKYYINNRWVTRTHALTAHPRDIKPGEWRDLSNRFLPCLFNELVNYVEIELAWFHIAWEDKEARMKYNVPFWATGWFRWRTWRCPQAGIDNLHWQINLKMDEDYGVSKGSENYGKSTPQAENAKEILALYTWWTEVYRNRPDPHDASGWTELFERRRARQKAAGLDLIASLNEPDDPTEIKDVQKALNITKHIEEEYENEDEAMMIRLIKIRNSLWT